MLSSKIIEWYGLHQRDLPWRQSRDPYRIWLSEVILQQTRVDQGLAYYYKFIQTFPTVHHLAQADEANILRIWQGLGYYSRARNLHKAAKQIVHQYNGSFPPTYQDLLKLPGVGSYTAAAIASIAFGEARAVVDGNVFRVLSRIFSIETPIDTPAGKKEFEKLANELLDKKNPAAFNQGLMEIGALVCKPKNPDCFHCPIHLDCQAYAHNNMETFPVKSRTLLLQNRYFNYLVIRSGGKMMLTKRESDGIWKNLYEFPLIETTKTITSWAELEAHIPHWLQQNKAQLGGYSGEKKHLLSHRRIFARFWEVELGIIPSKMTGHFYDTISLEQLPKHQLIVNYLLENSN